MSAFWDIQLVIFGIFIGTILTSMVGRWLHLVAETLKSPTPHPRRMAALVSLFHAGPWILVVVVLFAYFQHSERWAKLLGVGILLWAVIFALLAYRLNTIKRARGKQNAA